MSNGQSDLYPNIVSGYRDVSDHVEIDDADPYLWIEYSAQTINDALFVDQSVRRVPSVNRLGKVFTPYYWSEAAICTVIDVEGLWLTIGCE